MRFSFYVLGVLLLGLGGTVSSHAGADDGEAYSWATDSVSIAQGRLTLTTATPITVSDVTAATTVYYTPFNGNKIAVYSGSSWQLMAFTEKSVSVPSTTSTNFDVFAYNNSGTLTLETVSWTDATTRATALALQDGVYVKSGATTRRYLGTGRTTTSSGQIEDSLTKRFLWNMYNRTQRRLSVTETTASWVINLNNTFRQVNGNTANRVEVVVGLAVSPIQLYATLRGAYATVAFYMGVAIGEDSTVTPIERYSPFAIQVANLAVSSSAQAFTIVPQGYHAYNWLEYNSASSGSFTFISASDGMSGWVEG